jgi:hypothetical protein
LRVARQGQAQIGVERAFVKLVKQHGGDAGQFRIVENPAREDTFRDDFDPGHPRHFRTETDAVADGLADLFAKRVRHPLGAGASRDPSRLQHDDFLVSPPRRIEQRQRYPRGLAGAGRRDQHRSVASAKRARQLVQHHVDRKRRVEAAGQGLSSVITREARLTQLSGLGMVNAIAACLSAWAAKV